ncbi:MAG: Rpn family recombination-promoting nuclease/putative transposase, partial [Erysipelotrichaceae bacterium]|nr:Rpn family recombination-promoting nuclease/putative transposase [Erysipelotrichaceae bacterium]
MPKIDVLTRKYISKPERFAELFNTFAFDGAELVMSKDLTDLPPSQNVSLSKTRSIIQRERDLLKLLKIMTDGESKFVLLGAENQTAVHYGMPVRVMVYDALQYALQIEELSSAMKQKSQNPDRNEFLSGMMKNAAIKPVITLVIYWGSEKWDGPLSLSDMFDPLLPASVRNFAEDYRIKLLDMNAVPDEVIDSLKTDLKQVLYFRKYADNPARLNELLNRENSIFENVARDAAELLSELTNTPIRLPKYKGGTVNMCEAVRQMCVDAAREAVIKAKAESEEALTKVKAESEKA